MIPEESNNAAIEELVTGLLIRDTVSATYDVETQRRLLAQRVATADRTAPVVRQARRRWYTLATIAAAIVIAVFGITSHLSSVTTVTRTYSTNPGERASITLADGSTVTLAPSTTMEVLGANGRNIKLDGEAVFRVIQHTGTPFTVNTGKSVTRVLGTTFGVRAYSEDQSIRIAVADGRVAVAKSVLSTGDVADINARGQTIVTHNSDMDEYLGWTKGTLTFHRTPLGGVIRDLNRWYDLDIQLPDASLATLPVTATYTDRSATEVITNLTRAMDMTYTRAGRRVILSLRNQE